MAYVFIWSQVLILLYHQQGVCAYCFSEADAISNLSPKISGVDNKNIVLPESNETLNCSCKYTSKGLHVDCSERKFLTVPKLPFNTVVANFSHNEINKIQSTDFTTTKQLIVLDLSYNMINTIAHGAFSGLVNLQMLFILESNLQNLTAEELNSLIEDLVKLNNLTITVGAEKDIIQDEYTYKKGADTQLPLTWRLGRIETLAIDADFLATLSEADKQKLGDSWDVKYLTLYNINFHLIEHFTNDLLRPMKQLVSLTIYTTLNDFIYLYFDFDAFSKNKKLEDVAIIAEDPNEYSSKIIRNVCMALSRSFHLKKLEFSGFKREKILLSNVFSALNQSKTLSTIILNRNSYEMPDFSMGYENYRLPNSVRSLSMLSSCVSIFELNMLFAWNYHLEAVNISINTSLEFCGVNREPDESLLVTNATQRNLKITDSDNLKILKYTNNPHNFNLSELSLSTSYCENLWYLDMSYNTHMNFDKNIFDVCYNLEYLDFTGCHLKSLLLGSLRNLTKIKFLYLSQNFINSKESRYANKQAQISKHMNDDSLSNMKNLQVLDLSVNKLNLFKYSLKELSNLQLLNISGNNIKVLTRQNMKELDQLADKNANFTLDLSKQTLWCTCETIEFLVWIQTTKTTLALRDSYVCDFPKNTNITDSLIKHLQKSCSSYGTYIIVSSIGFTICLIFTAVALYYRHKWRLRYLFFMAKLSMNIFARKGDYVQIYEYDAFISYASEDFELARNSAIENLEVMKGLKLCVHERDFKPGDSIAFNISRGIHDSKRTLVFLSKAFFASEWCRYEINIARMETLYNQRDVVLAIMLEDVPHKDMDVAILDFINTSTYLEYPQNNRPSDVELFWNKCYDFIVKD